MLARLGTPNVLTPPSKLTVAVAVVVAVALSRAAASAAPTLVLCSRFSRAMRWRSERSVGTCRDKVTGAATR